MKTNAMRALDKLGIEYGVHTYSPSDGEVDGAAVARKLGRNEEELFKTLVTKGGSGGVYIFCIPVAQELALKAAARAAGEKNIAMLPLADITKTTGYVRGGVSPLAMKKQYPTFVHASAQGLERMVVSAGQIGYQIELAPQDLLKAAEARWFEG